MFEIVLTESKIGYKKCIFDDGSSGIVQICILKGSSVFFTGPSNRLVFGLTDPDSFIVLRSLNTNFTIPGFDTIPESEERYVSSFPGDNEKSIVFWRPENAAFFFV